MKEECGDRADGVNKFLNLLKEFIKDERQVVVSENNLNRILELDEIYFNILKEKGVKITKIAINSGSIKYSGSYNRKKWNCRFFLTIALDHFVWEPNNHSLFVKIVDHDVVFEKSIRGFIGNIGYGLGSAKWGKQDFFEKLGVDYENGVIPIPLDGNDLKLKKVIDAIQVNAIRINEKEIVILVEPGCLETIFPNL